MVLRRLFLNFTIFLVYRGCSVLIRVNIPFFFFFLFLVEKSYHFSM
jgi:hypothetical protein